MSFFSRNLASKTIRFALLATALFASLVSTSALAKTYPRMLSRSVLVMNATNGRVLYQKNTTRAYPIASLTKLMTAMVVLDSKQSLQQKITVTSADRDLLKHTHSRLTIGSVLSRKDMLHIALMSSENRAAAALSRYYPGGRKAFVRQMNRKARAYGMRNTHFYDPTGLTPRNTASAHDLAIMAKHAYRYALIRQLSTDKRYVVHPGRGQLVYRSSDGLINNKTWNIVLQKTGFTDQAGHCLIIYSKIKGQDVLMVIAGGPRGYSHYHDALGLKAWLMHGNL
ncbi:serine hydrolase [Serratia sp. M24T3]|uniref:serine hydrolase n=1 Tax=Serratia sp. M24T3 TaxID=932213 RepID=UPI00025B9F37|nr:serine hydrolase [Serratia sp. M24T3]EIC85207.1 peptidase S11 D-alanyl-D-alanine carboxypeptidase 1 [Serratia sp. M24T3]